MIVKMKFLSITGPKEDIGRVTEKYLSKYEIHLENALSELKNVKNLMPYIQINPYRETLKLAEEYTAMLPETSRKTGRNLSLEEAVQCIEEINSTLSQCREERAGLESRRNQCRELLVKIEPFQDIPYNLSELLQFKYIKFHFGKIPKEYFEKFENYIYDNANTIFYRCHSDDQYVWGIYFAPKEEMEKIGALYSSMHFESIFLPNNYEGTPEEAYT